MIYQGQINEATRQYKAAARLKLRTPYKYVMFTLYLAPIKIVVSTRAQMLNAKTLLVAENNFTVHILAHHDNI